MEDKKINLTEVVATLEFKGTDKINQDLKEIEDSLDKILSKHEKMTALKVISQEQSRKDKLNEILVLVLTANSLIGQVIEIIKNDTSD